MVGLWWFTKLHCWYVGCFLRSFRSVLMSGAQNLFVCMFNVGWMFKVCFSWLSMSNFLIVFWSLTRRCCLCNGMPVLFEFHFLENNQGACFSPLSFMAPDIVTFLSFRRAVLPETHISRQKKLHSVWGTEVWKLTNITPTALKDRKKWYLKRKRCGNNNHQLLRKSAGSVVWQCKVATRIIHARRAMAVKAARAPERNFGASSCQHQIQRNKWGPMRAIRILRFLRICRCQNWLPTYSFCPRPLETYTFGCLRLHSGEFNCYTRKL